MPHFYPRQIFILFAILASVAISLPSFAKNSKGCVVILTDSEGLTAPGSKTPGFGETVHRYLRQHYGLDVHSKFVGGSNVYTWSKDHKAQFEVMTIEGDRPANQQDAHEEEIIIPSISSQLAKCDGSEPKILVMVAGTNMLWDGKNQNKLSANAAFLKTIHDNNFHCMWVGPPQVRISNNAPKNWKQEYEAKIIPTADPSKRDHELQKVVDNELHAQVDKSGGCHYLSSLNCTDVKNVGLDGYHYTSAVNHGWANCLMPSIDKDVEKILLDRGAKAGPAFQSNPRLLGNSGYEADATPRNVQSSVQVNRKFTPQPKSSPHEYPNEDQNNIDGDPR